MITNDKGVIPLKHRVIEGLARLAWKNDVNEESKERLVRELSPGPKAVFRCCVYKEREILRREKLVWQRENRRLREAIHLLFMRNSRGFWNGRGPLKKVLLPAYIPSW